MIWNGYLGSWDWRIADALLVVTKGNYQPLMAIEGRKSETAPASAYIKAAGWGALHHREQRAVG